jgi:hypothetical protein
MDLFEDLVTPNALLVGLDDLVVSDAYTGVAVLEEPIRVFVESLIGLHDDPPEVEGISRVVAGHLEVGREGLG